VVWTGTSLDEEASRVLHDNLWDLYEGDDLTDGGH
jgi:hypothetical protein